LSITSIYHAAVHVAEYFQSLKKGILSVKTVMKVSETELIEVLVINNYLLCI